VAATAPHRPDAPEDAQPSRPPLATRGLIAVALALAALLVALSARYGYHRDELYFLVCGHHLAWGYPDQPPITPLIARLMSELSATSLVVLRLPSALLSAGTVFLTGLIAREIGAGSRAQVFAAIAMAVDNLTVGAGHLLSTTTFDLTAWAGVLWLALRAVRTGRDHLWLAVGVVAGIGLLDNDLMAFLVFGLVAGVVICGPRRIFASHWLWLGAVVMVALWSPYLVWQARHGWPQLTIADAIANGSSGTSQPRWAFIPFQLVLSGAFITPVWVAGLWRLTRDPSLRWCRPVAVCYFVLVALFVATGGKPYYIGGLEPALIAAGAAPVLAWCRRGRWRRGVPVALTALSLVGVIVTLPVLPLAALHRSPVVALNYDAGETVAWPEYVREMAAFYDEVPSAQHATTVVLTSNYGEAGAVDRYGGPLGLPSAYSVQNAFWLWGPPSPSAVSAVLVGFDMHDARTVFTHVRRLGRLHNSYHVDNDEQGAEVLLGSRLRAPWRDQWRGLRDYG
jgi:hypothetical protein